jgi:hypothetical protein
MKRVEGVLTCKESEEDWRCEGARGISCKTPPNSLTFLNAPFLLVFF